MAVDSVCSENKENIKTINKHYKDTSQMYHQLSDNSIELGNLESNVIDKNNFDSKKYMDRSDIYNLDQNMNKLERLSEMQKFYDEKNILITGATGFLGKILVEKLLRCCPGVRNLYLLVRQKRGKDIYTRADEIFDDPVFNRLKELAPKFRHKIVVVAGDCEAPGLGLTLEDTQLLIDNVNIIFHSAATVKFDEHLRAALETNVRAPLHLLRLARNMKGLDVLMHVSTAYSNSHLALVEERFYPCDADSERIHDAIDKLTDMEINNLLTKILGPWPNTYTFTKALAEKELLENSGSVPLGIFRPAIVISTYEEPLKGWLDNMYGPAGVAVGCATGLLRTLQAGESVTADIVPVDYVVNGLMAAAVAVHKAFKLSPIPPEPPIYNYVSSVENPITWGQFQSQNIARIDKYPLSSAVWYISLTLNKSATMNRLYIIFLHLLPAVVIDGLAICIGKKPKMLKVYKKIHKFSSVLSYFSTREIKFCNRRTRELWNNVTDQDKQLFPFSMREISWDEYFEEYLAGIRRYLFKESDDTLPQARIKWKRLYYLHQIVKLIFFFLFAYVLWWAYSAIF